MGTTLNLTERLDRRLKSGSLRTKTVGTRVSSAEEHELIAIANREGLNVSEWAREVLLREARSARADALFTELVALRMMFNTLLRPICCGQTLTPDDFSGQVESIRVTKHKVAKDVLAQYAPKER